MRQRLMSIVVDILKRTDNQFSRKLITGSGFAQNQKPRKIEGWLQIELAKVLNLSENAALVTDVLIEQFNHDIVAKHHTNGQTRTFGLEMKIGLTAAKVKRDLFKLRESKKRGHIQDGYFLFLHVFKEIRRKHANDVGDAAYLNQFCEGAFMRELSGHEEEIRTFVPIEVEPRNGCKCRCLLIGCVKV